MVDSTTLPLDPTDTVLIELGDRSVHSAEYGRGSSDTVGGLGQGRQLRECGPRHFFANYFVEQRLPTPLFVLRARPSWAAMWRRDRPRMRIGAIIDRSSKVRC